MKAALIAVALCSTAASVQAQSPAPSPAAPASPAAASPAPAASPAAPAAPAPAPELQKLGFLVGDWVHDETFGPSPTGPAAVGKARSKTAWVLGNHHLYVIYAGKSSAGQSEGRGFLGWDPLRRQYRFDWYDSMGRHTRYNGDFDAAGALVLSGEAVADGRPARAQFTIRQQPDGKVTFSQAMAGADGAMKTAFESVATAEKK